LPMSPCTPIASGSYPLRNDHRPLSIKTLSAGELDTAA
jgi:hypothetical protein